MGLRDYVARKRERIEAYKLVLKTLDRAGCHDEYKERLHQGQIEGEELLWAEAALGEVLGAIPDKFTSSQAGTRSLPEGIDKKSSHYAQELYRHPEAIDAVVAEANERGEIPVRSGASWSRRSDRPSRHGAA